MGIGLQQGNATIAAIQTALPAGTGNRLQRQRNQTAAAVNRLQEFIAKLDAKLNAATDDFAAGRPAQFGTFSDAIADPVLDANPADPNN